MSVLKGVALWIVAFVVAVWVLHRLCWRKPVILRGAWAMRVVRIIALVLVLVGANEARAGAQPIPPPVGGVADVPAALPAWLRAGSNDVAPLLRSRRMRGSAAWIGLRRDLFAPAGIEPGSAQRLQQARRLALMLGERGASPEAPGTPPGAELSRRIVAHLDRRLAGQPETVDSLLGLIQAAEDVPVYDASFAAWLFRASGAARGTTRDLEGLFARIERHLRVTYTLVRAEAEVGPVHFGPWTLKGSPPRGYSPSGMPDGLVPAVERLYPRIRPTTWERDACLDLEIATRAGHIALARGGLRVEPVASPVRLCRLSVLEVREAPAVLRSRLLGDVAVPADTAVHAWSLPELLDGAARGRIGRWIEAARRGDDRSSEVLEATLLASHAQIRASLVARPDGSGAGRLRTLLALFEE